MQDFLERKYINPKFKVWRYRLYDLKRNLIESVQKDAMEPAETIKHKGKAYKLEIYYESSLDAVYRETKRMK